MKLSRRTLIVGTSLACLGTPMHAQGSKSGPPRKVVLGQSAPLTGAADQIGLAYVAGAKLFFDAYNERSGAAYVFEQRVLDDAYSAEKAQANARKLVVEGADLLFGFFGTDCCDGAARVARELNAILFAPYAASNALRSPANNHVFHVRPGMNDEAFRMVKQANALGQGRIAVLTEDDAMGREGLAAVTAATRELGVPSIIGSAVVPTSSDKVDAAVASLLKLQPQAVIQASLFQTSAAFTRKMRRAGYGGSLMNFSVVGLDPLYTALGKEITGVVVSQVVPSPTRVAVPIVKDYVTLLDKSDHLPTYAGLEGFIAAKTLAESVRRTGRAFDTPALQKTMLALNDYDVGGLRINLRAGLRDANRTVDLVTIAGDGKVLR
ncbi:MAG: ABC transporter substrate-binding protein [Burkholderiaceae bacterium]